MKYEAKQLTLEEGIKREWLITNGIGGYACSTIIGANTRKYHGLLIAPFSPPANRMLILSKLDESISTNGRKYNLYTNICKNYISDGYKKQTSFEKEYFPIFKYRVEDIIIEKSICMKYGENTVIISYDIYNQNSESKLTLAPVINYRYYHGLNKEVKINLVQEVVENKVKMKVGYYKEAKPIYISVSEGNYIKHENDIFKNMYYIEEEKRGQEAEENHIVPGRYEIKINPNEQKNVTFVCSLDKEIEVIDGKKITENEIKRIEKSIKNTKLLNKKDKGESYNNLIKDYCIAVDNFIVYRSSIDLHTIIAGYPWFLDWGRDTLISFEGLLLKTRKFNEAKEVLLMLIRDIKNGLVPNGYCDYDNKPLYNSVDASLLLFEQVKKFLSYTNEHEWVKKKIYSSLENIIEEYIKGIKLDGNNIYIDEDGLISSGTLNTQNTWMDVKVGGVPLTPRNGKAVEINSMWYNALKIMEELTTLNYGKERAKKYNILSKKCKKSFEDKFYNKKRKCLYDVLGDSKIRPNQLFALSLSYQVIVPESEIAKEIVKVVTKKLLTPYGLRSLAKGEVGYIGVYEGDIEKRDRSYHQGVIWPWLLGTYYDALNNMIKAERKKTRKAELEKQREILVENTKKVFLKEMYEKSTVGNICEIYDYKNKKYRPKGAIAQAWSVAEIFRIIL